MSILWIISGHRMSKQPNYPNLIEVHKFYDSNFSMVVSSHTLAVDTFVLMGELLVTWAIMQSHEKGKVNLLRMFYCRYICYTPVLAVILLYNLTFENF